MPARSPLDASVAATWAHAKAQSAPAYLFEIAHGRLHDANEAGLCIWFWPQRRPVLPVSLDVAMPALAALRAGGAAGSGGRCSFCFWTPRGPLSRFGKARRLADGVHIVVTLDEAQDACVIARPGDDARQKQLARAKLAHELRTPIGAVAAYAEVLAGEHFGPLGNARYREYARNMREGALHALAVIEDMLGATRDDAAAGRRELRFRDIDPSEVIQSCFSVMRPIAEAAGVRLRISVPETLPRIIADEVSLRQMLLNLLTNAVKFARSADEVTLGVSYGDDGSLNFAVEDTGPGLAATGEAEAVSKGLGLGLPLTRELAAANGAALEIESAPGLGTRARISFSHTRVVV